MTTFAQDPPAATRELTALAVRLAEARLKLDRCRSRRSPTLAWLLAGLIRDFDAFFAVHRASVEPEFEATVRSEMARLGEAVLRLQVPAGRA